MLWDERSAVQRASQTPSTGLPVEAGMEALTAGFDFTQSEEKSTSLDRALYEEYDAYLDKVEKHTGSRIPNPVGFAPRDLSERRPGMTGQLGAQVRLRRQQEAPGGPVTGWPGFEESIKKARDLNPQGFPEPPTAGELLDRITAKLGASRERYEQLQERMTAGGTVANFVGSMGALATDPIVAGSVLFGAAPSRALVQKMLIEAGIAGASELAVQPYILRTKEAIDSPYTAADAAMNVLAAAGLGAAFPLAGSILSASGRKATETLGRVFHPEKPLARPATKEERAALHEVERAAEVEETAPVLPGDMPAHAERFQAEVEAVRQAGEPSQLGDLDVPPAPVRVAEIDAENVLDDATRTEVGTLAREDADLARAMDAVEEVRTTARAVADADAPEAPITPSATPLPVEPEVRTRALEEVATVRGQAEMRRALGEIEPDEMTPYLELPDVLKRDGPELVDVQAHGIAGAKPEQQLARLLTEGIDQDRAFHTGPLGQADDATLRGAGLGAKVDSPYVLLSKPNGDIKSDGIAAVLVNGEAKGGIEKLRAAFPEVEFVTPDGLVAWKRAQTGQAKAKAAPSAGRIAPAADSAGQPIPDPAEDAKELEEFTGSDAEAAILEADVERALGPPPLTPEQIKAQKTINRRIAAQKAARTVSRDIYDAKGQPKSLLAWLKAAGGIRDSGGELAAMDLRTSRPGLVRRTGANLEQAAKMATEDGYLPGQEVRFADGSVGMQPRDDAVDLLLAAMREELAGTRRYSDQARDAVEEMEQKLGASRAADELEARVSMLEGRAEEIGFDAPQAMLEEAVTRAAGRGTDPLDELDVLIEEDALRLADDWESVVDDDLADIPFEPSEAGRADRAAPGAQQAAGGDAGGQAGAAAGDRQSQGVDQAPGGLRGEAGAEGFDQIVIPGAERSAAQALAAREVRGIAARAPQRAADEGLFAPPPDARQMMIPVDDADPFTGEPVAGVRTAQELLDELDADQRMLDEMASCAAPAPKPGTKP